MAGLDERLTLHYVRLGENIAIAKKKNIKAVCPLILGENNLIQRYHHKRFDFLGRERTILGKEDVNDLLDQCLLIKEDANAFVGLMVDRNVVRNIGFPMKELFIWGDDTEYTLRISKYAGLYLFMQGYISLPGL
jgi:GT2 family glycosyltransferase